MKLIEAITQIDALKPNSYTQLDKIRWLSNLDWSIKTEIIDTHEGAEEVTFVGYKDTTPLDTELLVPAPYDVVYLRWLEARIDYANGEIGRYNNSSIAYNEAYSAFRNYYNRQNKPLTIKFKFF